MTINPTLPVEPIASAVSLTSAAQALEQLSRMAGQAGELCYRRVALAAQLLADKEWLASDLFGGDKEAARQYLEERYFSDLCGAMTLGQLVLIYRSHSDIETWRQEGWNLQKLWAMNRERWQSERRGQPKPQQPPVASPKSQHRQPSTSLLSGSLGPDMTAALDKATNRLQRMQVEIDGLKADNERLQRTIHEQKDRIHKILDENQQLRNELTKKRLDRLGE